MESLKNAMLFILSSIDVGGLSGCLAAIISLYIPIAILIYQELNDAPAFNKFNWDKTVLLQRVIKGHQILGAVLLSSIAIIFWKCNNGWIKSSMLLLFVIGISLLVKNLVSLFRWFMSDKLGLYKKKNYRQKQKIEFLKGLDPNNSLDVWSDLFSTIELENAYLKDYLRIFFDKLLVANQSHHWQYECCLVRNMSRLYYQNPDFQNEIVDFAFDAYIGNKNNEDDIVFLKKSIVRQLLQLLIKNNDRYGFSISRSFDKKLANIESSSSILNAVKDFSSDVLCEIAESNSNNTPQLNSSYGSNVFPLDKWNILTLINSDEEKTNAKAQGLFISYLKAIPKFIETEDDKYGNTKLNLLDEIVFGPNIQNISRWIIRVICLYFMGPFTFYDDEEFEHARIRKFIDSNYRFLLVRDISCSISLPSNFVGDEEERLLLVSKNFKKEEDKLDNNTIRLLSLMYTTLLDADKMKSIKKAINNYDLNDKNYQYSLDPALLKHNLETLKIIIDKIVKYNTRQNSSTTRLKNHHLSNT